MKQMTANPYLPRNTMMSVGILELVKFLFCVVKCSDTELDIFYLEISVCILLARIATGVQHNNIEKVNIRCGTSSRNI